VAIVKLRALRCAVPYALEGLMRREIELAGARLDQVQHADLVQFDFSLQDSAAVALMARLAETGGGRIVWLDVPDEIGE
jgi:hypothetical protein